MSGRVARPVMLQNRETLTFLHWRYPHEDLQPHLPAGLEVDLFDGEAWIGLTPFRVADLRPPALPALPWLSTFPETNVRTYVRDAGGARGIWFFSLEAGRLGAVLSARSLYRLPYRWARMGVAATGGVVRYRSRRHRPLEPAGSRIEIRIGEAITPNRLEEFLTARFRLYTVIAGRLAFGDVEHDPWPLRRAQVVSLEQPEGPPLAHYSPGVHTRIGRPTLKG